MSVSRPVSVSWHDELVLRDHLIAHYVSPLYHFRLSGIQKKRFEIPQESKEWGDYYCNESAYANFNVLLVTGVVRLDPTAAATGTTTKASTNKQRFDVWPTASQKEASRRSCHQHWSDMGVGDFFPRYDY